MIFAHAEKAGLQRSELQKLSVASYLEDNVRYDKEYTAKVLDDALSSLSASTGMVQQGERIIDRGEIVTPHIYNILRSYNIEQVNRLGGDTASIINVGLFLYLLLLFSILGIYLLLFCKPFLQQPRNLILLILLLFAFVALTELQARTNLFPIQVIPYVMLLILLRAFFGSHLALNTYLFTILASAYFVPSDPLSFIFIQLSAGFTALFSLQSLTSRGQIIRAAFLVFLVYIGASMIVEWGHEGAISRGYWIQLLLYGVNLIFLMFSYIFAFIVERIFGYVSSVRLVELSDTNMPLLQELSEIAPGTFQHSYQVSILATAAATKIGADAQLIRTGALYTISGRCSTLSSSRRIRLRTTPTSTSPTTRVRAPSSATSSTGSRWRRSTVCPIPSLSSSARTTGAAPRATSTIRIRTSIPTRSSTQSPSPIPGLTPTPRSRGSSCSPTV